MTETQPTPDSKAKPILLSTEFKNKPIKINTKIEKYFPPVSQIVIKIPVGKIPYKLSVQQRYARLYKQTGTSPKSQERIKSADVGYQLGMVDPSVEVPPKPSIERKPRRRLLHSNVDFEVTLGQFEKDLKTQKFDDQALYNSYIKYAKENGVDQLLEFEQHQNTKSKSKQLNIQSKPTIVQKQFDVTQAVDPLYGIQALNDQNFVNNIQKKWGTDKTYLKPNIKSRPFIDSHKTLSKQDQRKVNLILNRNLLVYYNYAIKNLQTLPSSPTSQPQQTTLSSDAQTSNSQRNVFQYAETDSFKLALPQAPQTSSGTRPRKQSVVLSEDQSIFDAHKSGANFCKEISPRRHEKEKRLTVVSLSPELRSLKQTPVIYQGNQVKIVQVGKASKKSVFLQSYEKLDSIKQSIDLEKKSLGESKSQMRGIKTFLKTLGHVKKDAIEMQ